MGSSIFEVCDWRGNLAQTSPVSPGSIVKTDSEGDANFGDTKDDGTGGESPTNSTRALGRIFGQDRAVGEIRGGYA